MLRTLAVFLSGLLICTLVWGWKNFDPRRDLRYPVTRELNALAGTFGELRSNHFHSGLDIKTDRKIGKPVYAVEAGYVYRVRVSPRGYGKALYLRHPGGNRSVYAHLSAFSIPEIDRYIYDQQKQKERYEVDLQLDSGRFTVEKGELIALSGNSGSSVAPHLHFEIRDAADRPINPLSFYRDLIEDHRPPVVQRIAFQPFGADSRVNGKFEKYVAQLEGGSGEYRIARPVPFTGALGIEYQAFDRLDAANNRCGINRARLYVDDRPVWAFDLNGFSFEEWDMINLHIDYAWFRKYRQRLQRAYLAPGNTLAAYPIRERGGIITSRDESPYPFRLELTDLHGNTTTVSGVLQPEKQALLPTEIPDLPASGETATAAASIEQDVWKVEITGKIPEGLQWQSNVNTTHPLRSGYRSGNTEIYLLPIRENLWPVAILDAVGRVVVRSGIQAYLAGAPTHREIGEASCFFPTGTTYAPSPLPINRQSAPAESYSAAYEVGTIDVPVHHPFLIGFQATAQWPKDRKGLVVARSTGSGWEFVGNDWSFDGKLYGESDAFGVFCVMRDTAGPELITRNFREGGRYGREPKFSLRLYDEFSGVNYRNVETRIDGNYAVAAYDPRYERLDLEIREPLSPGEHRLYIRAFDRAGNATEKAWSFSVK